ncbi:hypothetical protein GCM10010411_70050 [Actinomadura fulvescens]|uniref:Uncharacterized protein n=1 Tax=Actinomadura fulvescens TaxID=46160 RepID=A0ABP6CRA2_9ACTN
MTLSEGTVAFADCQPAAGAGLGLSAMAPGTGSGLGDGVALRGSLHGTAVRIDCNGTYGVMVAIYRMAVLYLLFPPRWRNTGRQTVTR